jgi:RNA polymerase sigma factor (sigma-70 family)
MGGNGSQFHGLAAKIDSEESLLSEIAHVLPQRDWILSVLAARTGGRWDVAEDLWADIVSWLVEQPERLAEVSQLRPWLYRLACNKAADWIRRRQRDAQLHAPSGGELLASDLLPSTDLPPLQILLGIEQHAELAKIMGQLVADDQEVLYLKYAHGWNYTQIGEHLGLTNHQVTNRLRMARQRLKLALLNSSLGEDYLPNNVAANATDTQGTDHE